jgi:hypothetical protein
MASTNLIGLLLPATGTLSGQWGGAVNNAISQVVDAAVAGTQTISTDADATLTVTEGAYDSTGLIGTSAQYAVIRWTANGSVTRNITVPAQSKTYVVINDTAGTQSIVIRGAGPTTGVTIPAAGRAIVAWTGSDFESVGGGSGGLEYVTKTANYTTIDKEGVLADTSGGAFTVTLPASPDTGAQVVVADPTGDWGTNNLTIGRNGSTISGAAEDLICDIDSVSVQLVYDGTTWVVYAQVGGNGGTVASTAANTFTGLQTDAAGADLASAATINLTAATGNTVVITGTVATSALTMTAGQQMVLLPSGAWPMTYNATTMNINGGVDQVCAAGDRVTAVRDLAGVIRVELVRQSGVAVVTGASLTGQTDSGTPFETSLGFEAGNATTGIDNSFVGYQAGKANSTGTANTAIGVRVFDVNTIGGNNVAIGTDALSQGNTYRSVAVGNNAMQISTGSDCVAIGYDALKNSATEKNVAVGDKALRDNTSGQENVAVGSICMSESTTGSRNTCIGSRAGSISSGSGNVVIGGMNAAGGNTPVFSVTTENNRVVMGSTAVTNAYIQVAWTAVSDARDKTNFGVVPHGLDFVKALQPISYQFRTERSSEEANGGVRYGFKAQDVLALEGNNPVIVDNEDAEKLRVTDAYLIPVLVNALQELNAKFDAYVLAHP